MVGVAYAGLVLKSQEVYFDELLAFAAPLKDFHVSHRRHLLEAIDFGSLMRVLVPPNLEVGVDCQFDPILLAKKAHHVVFLQVKRCVAHS